MKIVTLVTTVALDKDGNQVSTPPGVVDLDDKTAKDLLKRGLAKTVEKAKAEDDAKEGGVQVKTDGKGPKVEGQ